MTDTTNAVRPERMARRARMMRGANVVMRALLGLPLATPLSRRLLLVFREAPVPS